MPPPLTPQPTAAAIALTKGDRKIWTPSEKKIIILLGFLALAFVGKIVSPSSESHGTQPAETATPAASSCKFDWTKCADNSDMANSYDGWSGAKVACKYEAADRAKYGEPEWPWLAFSTFHPGTNYSTGIVTLIEPDAKFHNAFGATVRSRVTCEYDLRTKKVIRVSISER